MTDLHTPLFICSPDYKGKQACRNIIISIAIASHFHSGIRLTMECNGSSDLMLKSTFFFFFLGGGGGGGRKHRNHCTEHRSFFRIYIAGYSKSFMEKITSKPQDFIYMKNVQYRSLRT